MPTATKPLCPWSDCKQAIKRRRKGCCPHCGRPVYYINGFTSTEERPALSIDLWCFFMDLVARKERLDISLPVDSRDYFKELGFAILLLKRCDGDIDLAKETIRQCFQHKSLSFKTRTSLLHCLGKDFRLALAAARKVVAQRRAEEEVVTRSMARSAIEVPMPTF